MNAHLAIFGMVDGWFLARPVTVPRTDMGKRRYLRGIDSLYSYGGVVTSLGLASLVSFIASVSLEDPRKPFKRYVLQRGSVCGLFYCGSARPGLPYIPLPVFIRTFETYL